MGFANRAIVAAGLGFAVSALVGCGGSSGLLSQDQANRLSDQLESASESLSSYECVAARNEIRSFRSDVDNLGSVNSTLIGNLDQGAQTIATLAQSECPVSRQTKAKPAKKPTKQKTKTSTTTDTTATTTTTPTTTTTTTTLSTTTTGGTTIPTTTTGTATYPATTTGTTTTTTGTTTAPSSGGTGFGESTTTTGAYNGYARGHRWWYGGGPGAQGDR